MDSFQQTNELYVCQLLHIQGGFFRWNKKDYGTLCFTGCKWEPSSLGVWEEGIKSPCVSWMLFYFWRMHTFRTGRVLVCTSLYSIVCVLNSVVVFLVSIPSPDIFLKSFPVQPGDLKDKLFIVNEAEGGLSDEQITSLRRYAHALCFKPSPHPLFFFNTCPLTPRQWSLTARGLKR